MTNIKLPPARNQAHRASVSADCGVLYHGALGALSVTLASLLVCD